ncbi:MAG: serine/threonine protein kinase, partial [Chthoniobacterales bacterium]
MVAQRTDDTLKRNVETLKELFHSARELPPEKRKAFLDQACGQDDELRREIDALLESDRQADGFIANQPGQLAAELFGRAQESADVGRTIGQYKLLECVGSGGMGTVLLAERADLQFEMRVAIKLIKRGMDTDAVLRRFQHERQILASLEHPNIARLLDGGSTDDSLPYFVMEYISGERIDHYAEHQGLSIVARLELFRQVCSAVSYAHQHLVIHRDLKPSNILVTSEGVPKLLDFGIAKIIQADGAELATMTLLPAMTPEYASPEQIEGAHATTLSDVYSLGAVLYELLSGRPPYCRPTRSPEESTKAITKTQIEKPSAVVQRPEDARWLRGDLDNIVLMAMRKEPARRYASAGQFSEDIRRHLEGLPVMARKDTFAYRSSKFVARNRIAVAAALLVALAVVAGLIVSLREAGNARRQRDVAERERQKAQRINTFLQEMLGAAAPDVKGVDIKVADVLSEASRRAQAESANEPGVMAEVLVTLGRTYLSIGLYEPAVLDLRAALETSLKANGERHSTTARSMAWLSLALVYQDKAKEGEPI